MRRNKILVFPFIYLQLIGLPFGVLKRTILAMLHMYGIAAIVFPGQDLFSDGGKNKKFLFLINKKEMELPHIILVTMNFN
jgi:hypothetical protein